MKQGLDPIYNQATKILILGSAPSQKSLERQQYYGNPANQFWKIIFQLLEIKDPVNYQGRIEILLAHHLGLWDVYQQFERTGSLDSNFISAELNDFTRLLKVTNIKRIVTNGNRAYQEARKIKIFHHIPIIPALSTSGANNGRSQARIESWNAALTSKLE